MKRFLGFVFLTIVVLSSLLPRTTTAENSLLDPKEDLWLKSRNNVIVVYPEKNFPPYSYQSSSGAPQGLSIDYIEFIAKKIGATIEYLPARPLSQILDDVKAGKKGDVVTSLTDTKNHEDILYFSDTYLTSPAVIVVRKDADTSHTLTLGGLSGKKVAIGDEYPVEQFVRTNNPRIVIESVVDDESGLQQVLLGEVDAAIMDITSLSYYLSKQVLSSVKVAGNTGFDYKLAFAVPKDKEILQSILDKGLQQISTTDRQILKDKWLVLPNEKNTGHSFLPDISLHALLYILLCAIILILIIFLRKKRSYFSFRYRKKADAIEELKEEITELESTSAGLIDELTTVKNLEQDIKEKIKSIDR